MPARFPMLGLLSSQGGWQLPSDSDPSLSDPTSIGFGSLNLNINTADSNDLDIKAVNSTDATGAMSGSVVLKPAHHDVHDWCCLTAQMGQCVLDVTQGSVALLCAVDLNTAQVDLELLIVPPVLGGPGAPLTESLQQLAQRVRDIQLEDAARLTSVLRELNISPELITHAESVWRQVTGHSVCE